jgi:protein phosphatase
MTQLEHTPTPEIHFGAYSDAGRVRTENQDAYGQFLREDGEERLFVVADGMGGHRGGRAASTEALRVVSETYLRTPGPDVKERLQHAFQAANTHVNERAHAEASTAKMGTTCTALVLVDDRAVLGHVGDSRAYRLGAVALEGEDALEHGAAFEQLTQDHTPVAEMRREGLLTDAEAKDHPQRHVLSRALGIEPALEMDAFGVETPRPGDRFLLCTDGLLSLPEREIEHAMRTQEPQVACETLVQQANRRDGSDNLTALLVALD